jgi:hypothetical protein
MGVDETRSVDVTTAAVNGENQWRIVLYVYEYATVRLDTHEMNLSWAELQRVSNGNGGVRWGMIGKEDPFGKERTLKSGVYRVSLSKPARVRWGRLGESDDVVIIQGKDPPTDPPNPRRRPMVFEAEIEQTWREHWNAVVATGGMPVVITGGVP